MDEVQSEKNEEFTFYLKETLNGIKWSKLCFSFLIKGIIMGMLNTTISHLCSRILMFEVENKKCSYI